MARLANGPMASPACSPLDREERLRLIQFTCTFAWADQSVQPEERAIVDRFVELFGLDEAERAQVQGWLTEPPDPSVVDPATISPEHRVAFVEAIQAVILADGAISPEERQLFADVVSRIHGTS